ncbi:hypothetical protein [Paraprevotella clara]
MSAYMTFAIILTVAYIIYYGVTIGRDLYGKAKQGSSNEDTFTLGPVEAESTTMVNETENGFSVDNAEQPSADTETRETRKESQDKDAEHSEAEKKAERMSQAMDDAEVESGNGYHDFELRELLQQRNHPGILFIESKSQPEPGKLPRPDSRAEETGHSTETQEQRI